MKNSVMLKAASMSKSTRAKIVSVGAVRFNLASGEFFDDIHLKFDYKDSSQKDRKINVGTEMWWMSQTSEIKKELDGSLALRQGLDLLSFFFRKEEENFDVWCADEMFGSSLMCDAYTSLNLKIPWNIYESHSLRTANYIFESMRDGLSNKCAGGTHNSLKDALLQAELLLSMT